MSLPTTSYAVLGLLSFGPRSGYDLAQAADRSIAHFWPIAKSQVYGELQRLEGLGFVRGTNVAQEKLPDRRDYEITTEGRHALDEWLADPGFEPNRSRMGFLVKVFFGHRMSPDTLQEHLERYRESAEGARAELESIVAVLDAVPQAAYARATALYGLRVTEATLGWVDEVAARLPDLRAELAAAPPGKVAKVAGELFRNVGRKTR